MTENDRNCRTLIVSFVVAIMALVPLRFVELGQMGFFENSSKPMVLGVDIVNNQVVLPNAEVKKEIVDDSRLEAPYDSEIVECISNSEAKLYIEEMISLINQEGISKQEQEIYLSEIQDIVENRCE